MFILNFQSFSCKEND
ncbi:hypothetical protein LEMLEM_LOCUS1638 [Lemmus lemmus]